VNPSSSPLSIVPGLQSRGEWVAGIWELPALQTVQNCVEKISDKMGIVRFKYIFTGVVVSSIDKGNGMYTYGNRDVWVPASVMNDSTYVKHETVHEFAHIWDDSCNDCKGRGIMDATNGKENGDVYQPEGVLPTDYASTSKGDDWAESLTAYLYPEYAQYNPWDERRISFVKNALSWYVPITNNNSFPLQ
jgi:hypothetical protein